MKLRDATIIVLDTETTGLDTENDRICEVGWAIVRWDDERVQFYVGRALNEIIDPEVPIPAVASAVHHLTDKTVKGCPFIEELADQRFFDSFDLLVAHNAEFDRAFCVRQGLVPEDKPWLCTYRLARHVFPDAPSYKNQVLRYWLGFEDVSGDAHRAGHDAEVTAMILCKMLNDGLSAELLDIDKLIAFAEAPVFLRGRIGFGKHADKTWMECLASDRSYLQWMAKQGADGWDRDTYYTVTELLNGRHHDNEAATG